MKSVKQEWGNKRKVQGPTTLQLESYCPEEFSSNLNQTLLKQLINVLRVA